MYLYEHKLYADNLTNTDVKIIVSGYFGVIWHISMKATCPLVKLFPKKLNYIFPVRAHISFNNIAEFSEIP